MTTIVAIQGDGFAVIGTDSRISSNDEDGFTYQISTVGSGQSKVAANGRYLLGAAGDVRGINLIHHVFQPPICPPSLKGKRLDAFITAKFIPSLKNCFEEHGFTGNTKENQKAEHSTTIVVAINGFIYVVDTDYSWISDALGIYAIGSGAAYALGAMYTIAGGKKQTLPQSKKTCIKALTVASKFDPFTGPPFQTFVQESGNGKKQPE